MLFFYYFLLVALALTCCVILFQDFKHRQVSLWALILFVLLCALSVACFRDFNTLLYNLLSTLAYIGIIWLMLKLYVFLKFKKETKLLNELLGPADLVVILAIGLTLNVVGLVYFFCAAFILSLLGHLIYAAFSKKTAQKSVPLAGFLVIFYMLGIIVLYLVGENYYIDCSFINYE